jgi:hypothetical protein
VQGWWRHLRAFIITVLLALGFIAGWPNVAPRIMAQLPPRIAEFSRRVTSLQQALLRPFAPIAGALGIYSQNWPLFPGTGGIRHRLWIEAKEPSGAWTLLFRAHDEEHTAFRSTLEYRRVFNLWKPHHWEVSGAYPFFARWVARRIFLEHPAFEQVRVRQEQVEIQSEGRGFVSTGRFDNIISLERREVLP